MAAPHETVDQRKLTYEVKDVVLDDMSNLAEDTLLAVLEDFETRIESLESTST